MKFSPVCLEGAWLIDTEPHQDNRGCFSRTVCSEQFKKHKLNCNFVQQSISWNLYKSTLRGLHFQIHPYEEDKLVRVTRGSIFDVIVDIRFKSHTYGKWFGVELSADNYKQLYIPKGFAHGFQTLEDKTEVFYQMTEPFEPSAPRGIRYDDEQLNIDWPLSVDVSDRSKISEADLSLPKLDVYQ